MIPPLGPRPAFEPARGGVPRLEPRDSMRLRLWILASLLFFLFFVLPAATLAHDARTDPIDEEPAPRIATAPVTIDGRVLFRVRGASTVPATERAAWIAGRIRAVALDPGFVPSTLTLVDVEARVEIRAGEVAVLAVLDADGRPEQLAARELALLYSKIIERAIERFRHERLAGPVRSAVARAVGGFGALAAALGIVLWLSARLRRTVERRLQSRIRALGIQSFEVLRAESIWRAILVLVHTARALGVVALVLGYAIYALDQFPWTRASARTLLAWVAEPLSAIFGGLIGEIPSLIFLLVLFLVVRFVLRVIRLFFEAVGSRSVVLQGFEAEWAAPTYKIVRLALVAFAVVVAYPYIPGSGSAAFQGVSLFLGVVFSLGSSSFIGNLIAGYAMTYRRAFTIGDRVKIGNVVGDVTQLRLQATHVETLKNEEVVIPNATILNGEVTNYSALAKTQGLILHTTVGIGYEVPWRQVESMLLLAASRTPALLEEPRPFVLPKALGDFAITYEINAYSRSVTEMMQTYAELHRNILDVFNEHGVQIMTPAYEGDPAEPKLVPPERWFAAPASRPDPSAT